jgi:hypothetical protein
MFLHLGRFTKQMKEAYKNHHLDIGNIEDGLLISSGTWITWIENQYVPNAVKAAVMLLAGTLPKPGTMFRVEKRFPEPQYQIIDDYFYKYISRTGLLLKLVATPIMLTENYDIRMLQGPDRQVYGIRQDYLDMVDKEAIDFDGGESTPTGPCFTGDINQGIYWYNDFGTVMICPMATKKIEIPAVLSLLQFKEDGSIERRYFREAIEDAFAESTLDDDAGAVGSSEDGQPDNAEEAADAEREE